MKCIAKTVNGDPCPASAVGSGKYCYMHNPRGGKKLALARRRGGQRSRIGHAGDASKLSIFVSTLADANAILSYTLQELLVHENSIQRDRALITLYSAFVKSFEVGELEQRIAALEKGLKVT